MALTVTLTGDWASISGNKNTVTGTLAFDSSYPTGGESLTAAAIGLGAIDFIQFAPVGGVTPVVETSLPARTVNVKAYVPGATVGATGTETVDDTPLSGVAASTAVSISSTAASETFQFGLMKEVADTEDLSTLTGIHFTAVGS